MKKIVCLLMTLLSVGYFAMGQGPRITTKFFRTDLAFTCITVDSTNTIWAGTSGRGLVKVTGDNDFPVVLGNNFDRVIIRYLAADKDRGVWIAHDGFNGATATIGGIDYINRVNPANKTRYNAVSLISANSNKGYPSRRTNCIMIDKNEKVWSAHNYHDLTVPGGNPSYLVNPGGLGYKTPGMPQFDTVLTGTQPYPAWTRNTPINQTAGTRVCPSLGISKISDQVWMGIASYNTYSGFTGSRIGMWDLAGNYLGQIDENNSPLPLGNANSNPRAMAIHFDPFNRAWIGFNLGRGIGVRTGSGWVYPGLINGLLPAGTNINQNAIASNIKGEVFIGTTNGLLVYKGNGNVAMDTSYKFYTMTNISLPSNNITGCVIDKGGALWLATGAGIVRLTQGDLNVYHQLRPVPGNEMVSEKRSLLTTANQADLNRDLNGDETTINIAADSSSSTLIVFTGDNPRNKVIYIAQRGGAVYEDSSYSPQYGALKMLIPRASVFDSMVVLLKHPSFVEFGSGDKFRTYDLNVRDTVTGTTVMRVKLNVYHPPVMMVHGIWSSINAFETMYQYLKSPAVNNYNDYQLLRIWYTTDRHPEPFNSSVFYQKKVPEGIDKLLQNCVANKLSAGKVNIVGHSRGGIFSRLYLQGNFTPYRNDINKLITMNTPHAGSHTANLILDKRKLLGLMELGELMQKGMLVTGVDDPAGAVELKVNDQAITNYLNGPNKNRNVVPSHAISGIYKFGMSKLDILKAAIVNGGQRIPKLGSLILLLRLYALTLGTNCVDGPIDDCMKEIYNGEDNDIVVPLSSQLGGLPGGATTTFSDKTAHSNKVVSIFGDTLLYARSVVELPLPLARVRDLLRANPDENFGYFTRNGFNPPTNLVYNFLPGLAGDPETGRNVNATLSIAPSLQGSNFSFGQTANVAVTGSSDIQYVVVAYTNNALSDPYSDVEKASSFTFPFPVPRNALGRVNVTAYGFDANGLVAVDSSWFTVGLPVGVTLDSIKVTNGRFLTVPRNDSVTIGVLGYYSDTVRDITFQPGISYVPAEGKAVASVRGIKGVAVGFDRLTVSFGGKTDVVDVEVTDNSNVLTLPVTLRSFSARYVNQKVLLNWSTASEQNSKYFEVERSADGINFVSVGRVAAAGNSNSVSFYELSDPGFGRGLNYYRLRQTDLDERYTYSNIVLVRIGDEKPGGIRIYPNPATNFLVIEITSPQNRGWQFRLVNLLGQPVMTRELGENTATLSLQLPAMARGIYVAEVVNERGEKVFVQKIVKD